MYLTFRSGDYDLFAGWIEKPILLFSKKSMLDFTKLQESINSNDGAIRRHLNLILDNKMDFHFLIQDFINKKSIFTIRL